MKKICPRCKIEKELPSEFNSEGKYCKPCHNQKGREWRLNNPEKYKKSQNAECAKRKSYRKGYKTINIDYSLFKSKNLFYQKRRKLINYLWVLDYLKSHSCVDCGEKDPVILEFDHVRGKKDFNISQVLHRGVSLSTIQAEIKKCDVRCANCHRKRTAKVAGHLPYKILHENYLNSEEGVALQNDLLQVRMKKSDRVRDKKGNKLFPTSKLTS